MSRSQTSRATRAGLRRGTLLASVIAIGLVGGLAAWRVSATERPVASVIVPVTPQRILDTRVDVGLAGPFVSATPRQLRVIGEVDSTGGAAAPVPFDATGVMLNVTAVAPEAAGFVSVRPAGTPGAPATSSLNVEAGAIVANAVQVAVPQSAPDRPDLGDAYGSIEITFDAYGTPGPTAHILVDVVGYTAHPREPRVALLETSNAHGIPPGQRVTEEYFCGRGVAVSGGYDAFGQVTVEESRPSPDPFAWMITARNDDPTIDGFYNVWVLCLGG